jgi:hypothetical protein
MQKLRQLEQNILANGRVDGDELEVLRRELYAGGKIDRPKADFLVELHKRVHHMTPAFEHFFFQAIKDHILANGRISAEETAGSGGCCLPMARSKTRSESSCTN